MAEPLNAAARPSRLSWFTHTAVVVLLGLSFISGVLIWRGQSLQHQSLQLGETASPVWLHQSVVLHGSLNPLLCALFGYLCCQHIRLGWQLKANLVTGIAMEVLFVALIASGVGLYYSGSPEWRAGLQWSHRVLGLGLPVALAAHWVAAQFWVKKNLK